jgi:FKBP-type peptidyl-prolyl cis-trans isomerase (trigger factor)
LDLFDNTKRDAYTAHVVDLYLRKANYEYLEDILFMTEKEYPIHISKEQLEAEMEVLKPFRNLTKLEYLMSHEEKLPEELNTKIRNMNDPIPLDNIRTDYSLLEQEIKNKTNAAAKATGQDRQRLTSELKQLVSDRVKVYKKMEKEAEFEKALNTGEKLDKQFNELYKSYPQETKEAIYLALIKKKQIIRDLQNENALTVAGRTPNLQHPKMSVITSDLPQNPDKVKVYREDVLYEDFGYNKTLRPI